MIEIKIVKYFMSARIACGLLGVFFMISSAAAAQTAICPAQKISPMLHSYTNPIEYKTTKSAESLSILHYGEDNPERASPPILGLAGGLLNASLNVSFEFVPINSHFFCVKISKLQADFFASPEIRIASNFKRGSCEYDSVIEHERKHVAILNQWFTTYKPEFRKLLWQVSENLKDRAPASMSGSMMTKADMTAEIQSQIDRFMRDANENIAAQQTEIDTPTEYQRIISKCTGWGDKLRQ